MKRNKLPTLLAAFALVGAGFFSGCDLGNITESIDTISDRDISGIAGPGDPGKLTAIHFVDRNTFGSANTYEALGYPTLGPEGQALMAGTDPDSPLHFFITLHTDEEGTGPLFNQRRCLGCHFNSEDIKDNNIKNDMLGGLNTKNTPVSRAGRQGPTIYDFVKDNMRPNSAAFTLFGDYFPSSGAFDAISILGGPLQHVVTVNADRGCKSVELPSLTVDPILAGGLDPNTGLSVTGARRETGERAGPPYIGRGLMEAIYWKDLLLNEDNDDTRYSDTDLCPNNGKSCSSLLPTVDHNICPGDCVSGRHNENRGDVSIIGADPEVRVSRFGLRAAGPSMLPFVVGGLQGEIGLTNPFFPTEQNNVDNSGRGCDQVADPELKAQKAIDLRAMIRLFAPPFYAQELIQAGASPGTLAGNVQAGAQLFGIDLAAFRSRTVPGMTPVNVGDFDADRGIAKDRMLNCVGCHIPIQKTGKSPASIGAEQLSNKWAPLFSDLLIHKNPSLPQGRPDLVNPPINTAMYGNINRNLGDFAIPPSVTGVANGDEFRTAPLMGLGKTGAPFMHDARIYINIVNKRVPVPIEPPLASGEPDDKGVDPRYPTPVATTVFTSADTPKGKPDVHEIRTLEDALRAAIEIHDLPAPPDNNYANCPPAVSGANDVCSRNSPNRGEARNTIEKWHALTDAQQLQVVRFLESL